MTIILEVKLVFSGVWLQIHPIVWHAGRPDIIEAQDFSTVGKRHGHDTNMTVKLCGNHSDDFANTLLQIL